jgi:hypothetical protein
MEQARRRHVPAFGEWNYSSSTSSPEEPAPPHSGAAAAESWWWYAPEPEACSDAWFRYSPPPRRRPPAPKKARRPETVGARVVVAVAAEHKRAVPVAAVAAHAPAKGAGRRVVVRPVDEDLYRVPPPDDNDTAVSRLPRRRVRTVT